MATPALARPSLRAALDVVFDALPAQLAAPGSGSAACRRISDVYDQAIAERFVDAIKGTSIEPHRHSAVLPVGQTRPSMALVATGGWARREMAPYSDIDFIVLHDRDEAAAKRICDRLLYPLWDEKLAIGHAIREPRAAAKLAKTDLATATALLDARHIAGDRRLTSEMMRATLGVLAPGGNPNELIGALATENKARHDRFGAAIYVLEPNLKQGIGALRDLSTALWAATIRWHAPAADQDPKPADELIADLVAMGHLTRRQADVLANARDFQLRLRTLVQLTAKRRFDQLTFEIQEAIAPALISSEALVREGDVRPAVAPAVEALMQQYYVHARGVVQVAERLLEAARVPGKKRPKVVRVDDSFVRVDREIAIEHPQRLVERPSEMVRLFRVAVAQDLAVDGHTRELIAETIARDPAPLAADPVAAGLLLEALCDLRDRAQPAAFEIMHQLGILSALLPGWAPCTARVQHDLYHVYTVDQHQLYALAMQKRLARGELPEHALATELWPQVTRPAPLFLATLLHDVGKPLGKGHAEKGAVIAGTVARRLGMSEADVELAEFLVRQHLTMSHLSQRRDLSDPETIARFAERVGTEERLVALYLLTLCDTAMTAPDNLSAWKDGLLRDLMIRTRAQLRGGAPDEVVAEPSARTNVMQLVGVDDAAIVDGIDPRLLTQLTPRQAARHVKLVAATAGKQPRIGIEVHCFPMKGHSELAIVAPDEPGVLAAIAGALTANRVDVLGAILGHVETGSDVGVGVGVGVDDPPLRPIVGSGTTRDRGSSDSDVDVGVGVGVGAPPLRRIAGSGSDRRSSDSGVGVDVGVGVGDPPLRGIVGSGSRGDRRSSDSGVGVDVGVGVGAPPLRRIAGSGSRGGSPTPTPTPTSTRLVLDVFFVRDLKGEAIPDDDPRWRKLGDDLRTLLAGPPDPSQIAELIARRRPRSGMPKRVTPGVITEIKIHDDSTQATIVEVATLDRAGVLYAITHTLAELGLDISLAKIATEGEKVADVFYVTRAGRRITDDTERAVLIAKLDAAVAAPGLTS